MYEILYPHGEELKITTESSGSATKVENLTKKQYEKRVKKFQREEKKRRKKDKIK